VRQRPLNVNNARRRSKLNKEPMPNQNRLTDTVDDAKRKKMLNNLPKKNDKTNYNHEKCTVE